MFNEPLSGMALNSVERRRESFIASIDQGTTSSRVLIFDVFGTVVAQHQVELIQHYPHPGWQEQEPFEILRTVNDCIEKATETFLKLGHDTSDIKAVGITNQRETTIVWDSLTGEPLYNAIAWPDTRTTGIIRELRERDGAAMLRELCGLPLSTYPSAVKVLWLLQNVEEVRKASSENRLCFGTVDTWLVYQLNGGLKNNVHVTDTTNASRTMFMNLFTLKYSSALLDFFSLSHAQIKLPKIVPSSSDEAFGKISMGPLQGIRITGCLGDQSAALVGQQCFTIGSAKNTYGTGCFLLYNVGENPVISEHGLLATVGYDFGKSQKPVYALEGSVAAAGSAINFLINNLGFANEPREINDLAATVDDSGGCVFVTAFSGLFAPYWIQDAKGTIFGITAFTQKGHIARATLEAACFQTKAILDAMEKDSGHSLKQLAVDGGMSNSDLCMQTQSDLIGIPVDRPGMRESTSLGAAIAAGFSIGIWDSFEEIKKTNQKDRKYFKPNITDHQRNEMFRKWSRAVEMCRGWTSS